MSDENDIERDGRASATAGGLQVRPADGVDDIEPYRARRPEGAELLLHLNEGAPPPPDVLAALARAASDAEAIRRYPIASDLEARLAAPLRIDPAQVVVTGGGDDAIDRLLRAVLAPGRTAVLAVPTFEMIERGVMLRGAERRAVDWPGGPLPTDALLAAAPGASLVAVVSPCNPTGATATTDDFLRIADARPEAIVLADLAYVEFADEDPTPALLTRPNVVVVRTFSKFLGLAGLRVGYALCGHPRVARWLRAVGGPFPVSAVGLAAAGVALDLDETSVRVRRERVRAERATLSARLHAAGYRVPRSQANFVYVEGPGAAALRSRLARRGIAIRGFDSAEGDARPEAVRITCPGDDDDFRRLIDAIDDIIGPAAAEGLPEPLRIEAVPGLAAATTAAARRPDAPDADGAPPATTPASGPETSS